MIFDLNTQFLADAYDVMIMRNIEDIVDTFEQFGKPLVFGAELGCAPDEGARAIYPVPSESQSFFYLNSGLDLC